MLALLANWKLIGAGVAAIAVAGFLFAFQHERHARQDAERATAAAQAEATAARAQSTLNETAGAAAVQAETRAVQVIVRSQEATHAIEAAPGASDALPDPVRSAWLAGVRGVRDAASPAAAPDNPGRGEPSGAVPNG